MSKRDHDSLCKFAKKEAVDEEYDDCEYCELIRRARADERSRARRLQQ